MSNSIEITAGVGIGPKNNLTFNDFKEVMKKIDSKLIKLYFLNNDLENNESTDTKTLGLIKRISYNLDVEDFDWNHKLFGYQLGESIVLTDNEEKEISKLKKLLNLDTEIQFQFFTELYY